MSSIEFPNRSRYFSLLQSLSSSGNTLSLPEVNCTFLVLDLLIVVFYLYVASSVMVFSVRSILSNNLQRLVV